MNDERTTPATASDGDVAVQKQTPSTIANWRADLREVTLRVAAMVPDEDAPSAIVTAPLGGLEVSDLVRELAHLELRIEKRRLQVARDTRRQLADLEELHHANRMMTVGTLTASLAHEFGTPLGVVLARAQMIVNDETDWAEVRKDASEIIQQVKRLTQMCREVLDYARPSAAAQVQVDVADVVRLMIALLQMDARKRNAKLLLANDPPPSIVLGNASKIMQILSNLIINAAQAMQKGGTVSIRIDRQEIEQKNENGTSIKPFHCVHVHDDGVGISNEDLPHIFETFFTTKKGTDGTGLGLAVSRRIAREHGGWIGVQTEVGVGSTFSLFLPEAPATPLQSAH